jgi:hypothetical protein
VTRRILLVLLAFTATVLVGAVVPLTLDAAGHDRSSFIQATEGMARTDAAIAQARLEAITQSGSAKAGGYAPLVPVFNEVQQAGDSIMLLLSRRFVNSAGRPQIK